MRTHFIALLSSLALLLMGPYALANDAYEAWENKRYDEALQGFLDQQIESPNNRDLGMNVGSAHYMLGDFEKAANNLDYLLKMDPTERSEAFYNLGNTKYRQGKLDEALQAYQKTLELNPDDKEANYNLEFVRDEIRRRHEEAQKNPGPAAATTTATTTAGPTTKPGRPREQPRRAQNTMSDDPSISARDEPMRLKKPTHPKMVLPTNRRDRLSLNKAMSHNRTKRSKTAMPRLKRSKTIQRRNKRTGPRGTKWRERFSNRPEQALTPEEAQRYLDALDPDRPPTRKRARKGRRSRRTGNAAIKDSALLPRVAPARLELHGPCSGYLRVSGPLGGHGWRRCLPLDYR